MMFFFSENACSFNISDNGPLDLALKSDHHMYVNVIVVPISVVGLMLFNYPSTPIKMPWTDTLEHYCN